MTAPTRIGGDHQCLYWVGRCAEYLGGVDLFHFVQELGGDTLLIEDLESAVRDVESFQTKEFDSLFRFRLFRILLYALIRAGKPRLSIETGVLHGMTSAFLLRAIEQNGSGRLISVDLPSYPATGPANRDGYHATLPPSTEPGWMVAARLRPSWDLRLGSSRRLLPELRPDLEGLSFFLHDSEHTEETMSFELEFAWEALTPEGILVCDNVDSCGAFDRFCARVNRVPLLLPAPDIELSSRVRFGILRRSQ